MSTIWIAIASIGAPGLVFGLILGYASRRFAVEDDPVVEKIDELLPAKPVRAVWLSWLPPLCRSGRRAG